MTVLKNTIWVNFAIENFGTIDLSKKVIDIEKYGLKSLKEHLNIDIADHHRAYSDALSTTAVLKTCLSKLPKHIKTTEQLIKFSK